MNLTKEESITKDTIVAARQIQDFLWGGINDGAGFEEFRRMLRKRLAKLDQINFENPYWKTEARKRLLQLAAISIQVMGRLDDPEFKGSNLHEFAQPITEQA